MAVEPGKDMKQSVFPLNEGDVVLQWPAAISQESYEDFKVWLDLMARRVEHSIHVTDDDPEAP